MGKQEHWISARVCVYNVYYHLVWSTKYRRKVISDDVEAYLKQLHLMISDDWDFVVVDQEIMPDHVHLFINSHPKHAPSDLVKVLKGITAKKVFEKFPNIKSQMWRGHLWNPSFYIGTCGDTTRDVIEKYIELQKEK